MLRKSLENTAYHVSMLVREFESSKAMQLNVSVCAVESGGAALPHQANVRDCFHKLGSRD